MCCAGMYCAVKGKFGKLCCFYVFVEFCSKWPEGLETDDSCEKHFPVEVITRDYVRDGASIRDQRSRVVTIKVIII